MNRIKLIAIAASLPLCMLLPQVKMDTVTYPNGKVVVQDFSALRGKVRQTEYLNRIHNYKNKKSERVEVTAKSLKEMEALREQYKKDGWAYDGFYRDRKGVYHITFSREV